MQNRINHCSQRNQPFMGYGQLNSPLRIRYYTVGTQTNGRGRFSIVRLPPNR